jgi:23S rRNA (uracil1939-C5)-methyltransferase
MGEVRVNRPPLAKGDIVQLTITDLTSNGEGIGRYNNFAVFVPGALPEETVTARVISVQKKYARALPEEIIHLSPNRSTPACRAYGSCGGCQLQHLNYPKQLEVKRKIVQRVLVHIGKLEQVKVLPTLGMEKPWGYRNKAQFPLAKRDGRIVAGFFAPRSHRVVAITECPLQHPKINKVLQKFLSVVNQLSIPVYDETNGTGFLRHLLVRVAVTTGELMAVVVTNSIDTPNLAQLREGLTTDIPELTSLQLNVNSKRTNVILGPRWQLLHGLPTITEYLGPYRFYISGGSFFQVNPFQTIRLYEKAREYAGLTGKEIVVDAYCGIGTISLFMAGQAKAVHGIEVVPAAIDDAGKNAQENGINNAIFHVGEVEKVLPELMACGVSPDVTVLDPPRQGCRPEVLAALAAARPDRIVYVSCNPATLARDLGILTDQGYKVLEVQPIDMFPQTYHVECVTLMTNVKNK